MSLTGPACGPGASQNFPASAEVSGRPRWRVAFDQMSAWAEWGWDALRRLGPVVYADDGIYGVPAYYVTRREDILAAALDTEALVRVDDLFPPRYRRIVEPLLVPSALNEDMPAELRRRAAAVIRTAAPGDLGNAFAAQVFLALCGIAHERELPQAISERRTWLLAALTDQLDGDAQVIDALREVINAGFIGVAYAAQFAIVDLSNNPALADELRADPSSIAAFVDDLLRNRSPIPTIVRRATGATRIAGVDIPQGAQVELCIGALGHSPGHLEFGAGTHRCIGRHLSTPALTVFVGEWLDHVAAGDAWWPKMLG